MLRPLVLAGLTFALAPIGFADKLNVPESFPTIQAAVDAAQSGDTILIKKGTYEPADIFGKNNITLKKSGGGKVIIELDAAETGLRIDNSTKIKIDGIEVRGGTDSLGIWATGSETLVVKRCRSTETGGGLAFENCFDVIVVKCLVDKPGGDGVYLNNCVFVDVIDTKIKNAPGGQGFYGTASEAVAVIGCRVSNAQGGIYLSEGPSFYVLDNRIKTVTSNYGIRVDGDQSVVVGNVVKGSLDETGIAVMGDDLDVRSNVVSKSYIGIEMFGDNSKFAKNKCSGIEQDGLVIGGKDNFILKNKATSAKRTGITIDASNSKIQGNKAMKNGDYGMFVAKSGNVVSGNTSKKNDDYDLLDITGTGSNVYENNKFKTFQITGDVR